MQANRSTGTKPELALSAALRRQGLSFRKGVAPDPSLKCKADLIFASARVCVFVDGCYWHGCPRHFKLPKTNARWWKRKVIDNQLRDRRKRVALRRRGWTVIRVWECNTTTEKKLKQTVNRIYRVLTADRLRARLIKTG